MPPPTVHTERSGVNSPSVFTSKHVSVKAGKGNIHFKNRGRRNIFVVHKMAMLDVCCARKLKKALINGTSSDITIQYSVASPPLTLPTYPFSQYVMCIAGCVILRPHWAHDCRCLLYHVVEMIYDKTTKPELPSQVIIYLDSLRATVLKAHVIH